MPSPEFLLSGPPTRQGIARLWGPGRSCSALALFALAIGVAGCAPVTPEPPTRQPMVGLPNPATLACSRAGGVPFTERAADGSERGLCRLNSGEICDQWAFFRGECGAAARPPASGGSSR